MVVSPFQLTIFSVCLLIASRLFYASTTCFGVSNSELRQMNDNPLTATIK